MENITRLLRFVRNQKEFLCSAVIAYFYLNLLHSKFGKKFSNHLLNTLFQMFLFHYYGHCWKQFRNYMDLLTNQQILMYYRYNQCFVIQCRPVFLNRWVATHFCVAGTHFWVTKTCTHKNWCRRFIIRIQNFFTSMFC